MSTEGPKFVIQNPTVKGDFIGDNAAFYQRMIEGQTSGKIVTALSVRDAYEGVLGKPNPYRGETAESYMRLELGAHGYMPEVVSKEELKKILAK